MFRVLNRRRTTLSAGLRRGACSLRKLRSSHTTQEDTHMSQAFTLKNRSKLGGRYASCSVVRSEFVLRCVIVDHRRGPCQGIVHIPSALGTWSHRRHRCPRETGPAFSLCLCIAHRTNRKVEVTSCVDRGRDQGLHCCVCPSGEQRRSRGRI